MTRFLVRHIDRVFIVLALSLLIILSLKTLDNLANLAAVEAPQELRLDGGDLIALYTLNSGMNKPAILSRFGDALIELCGWNSYVTVDGSQLTRGATPSTSNWTGSAIAPSSPGPPSRCARADRTDAGCGSTRSSRRSP
jgi:hypothetical protein